MPLFNKKRIIDLNIAAQNEHHFKSNHREETAKEFHMEDPSAKEAEKYQRMLDMFKNLEVK